MGCASSKPQSDIVAVKSASIPSSKKDVPIAKVPILFSKTIIPEIGFVIKTKSLSDGSKVFINLLHHEAVSHFAVGRINNAPDKNGEKCTVYDIVVWSVLFHRSMPITERRDELVVGAIQFLNQSHKVSLSAEFKLPNITKGFVGDAVLPLMIKPEGNSISPSAAIPEVTSATNSMVTQSQTVEIKTDSISPKSNQLPEESLVKNTLKVEGRDEKREVSAVESTKSLVDESDSSTSTSTAKSDVAAMRRLSIPVKIPSAPVPVPSPSVSATVNISFSTSSHQDEKIQPPDIIKGYLKKKGHSRHNWKLRFFVVEAGVLSYYEEELSFHPYGTGLKDSLPLNGYIITKESPSMFWMSNNVRKEKKDLHLVCEAEEYVDDYWIASLRKHIDYADAMDLQGECVDRDSDDGYESSSKNSRGGPIIRARAPTSVGTMKVELSSGQMVTSPPLMEGWMMKKGHVMVNWKRRYFVMDAGSISYYLDKASNPPFGTSLKGTYNLTDCKAEELGSNGTENGHFIKIVNTALDPSDPSAEFMMEAFSNTEKLQWISAINTHILYANISKTIAAQEETKIADDQNRNSSANGSSSSSSESSSSSSNTSKRRVSILEKNKYSVFINEGETILRTALVGKKNPFGITYQRQLILTDTPRIVYLDPKTFEGKGVARLDKATTVKKNDEHTFSITTGGRDYKFTDLENGSAHWEESIMNALKKLK